MKNTRKRMYHSFIIPGDKQQNVVNRSKYVHDSKSPERLLLFFC